MSQRNYQNSITISGNPREALAYCRVMLAQRHLTVSAIRNAQFEAKFEAKFRTGLHYHYSIMERVAISINGNTLQAEATFRRRGAGLLAANKAGKVLDALLREAADPAKRLPLPSPAPPDNALPRPHHDWQESRSCPGDPAKGLAFAGPVLARQGFKLRQGASRLEGFLRSISLSNKQDPVLSISQIIFTAGLSALTLEMDLDNLRRGMRLLMGIFIADTVLMMGVAGYFLWMGKPEVLMAFIVFSLPLPLIGVIMNRIRTKDAATYAEVLLQNVMNACEDE